MEKSKLRCWTLTLSKSGPFLEKIFLFHNQTKNILNYGITSYAYVTSKIITMRLIIMEISLIDFEIKPHRKIICN